MGSGSGRTSIPCPKCDSPSEVLETRGTDYGTRRRRLCENVSCGNKFTTVELVAPWPDTARPRGIRVVAVEDLRALNEAVDRLGRGAR